MPHKLRLSFDKKLLMDTEDACLGPSHLGANHHDGKAMNSGNNCNNSS